MRISNPRQWRMYGSVLLITLCFCSILGILMASYLSLISTQHRSVVRSEAWHKAMVVAEAGIEEAMAQLNSGVTTNNLAVNSWNDLGNGRVQKQSVVGDSRAVVTIMIAPGVTNACPVIVSAAQVAGPLSGPPLSRTVQVQTKPKPAIPTPGAMVVTSTIDLSGMGIATDSFNSSDTNFSTHGLYDARKALDHGDVVTLSSRPNSIQVGNGKIKGKVRTGPEGQASVGANSSVGDMNWVNTGQQGIQDGHFADDVNVDLPPASLPDSITWLPPIPGTYPVDGVKYKYVLNNRAHWIIPKLDGSLYVNGGKVVLYVTDSIKIGSGMQIHVTHDASLTIYMGGESTTISGQGVVNESGLAKNFTYYGLPSNTQVTFGANAAFVGTIYAPQAAFALGGGGNNTYDFIGQCVTRSVKMNGHYNFHFDEALKNIAAPSGYVVSSWEEL